tara:strand:- start:3992 stop:4981 length:990 start_codon:yes stop_codon:yes gene_type:complete
MRNIIIFIVVCLFTLACNERPEGLDKRLKTYKYPHKTKLFKFLSQTQKLEMAYMYIKPAKEKDNGKTFLLIHGKNFSGAYYEETINLLKEQGYTIIVPDLIGFGRSSKPVNYQYSFHNFAHSLKKLLDWYKIEKTSVLGHSMGGMVATRFALLYPQYTEKLFLLNPIGLEDYRLFAPYKSVDEIYSAQLSTTPEKVKNYQLKSYYDNKWDSKYDHWLQLQTGWIKGPDWRQLAYISALTSEMIYTQPVVYEFDKLQIPTVLILGDRDRTALGKADVSAEVLKTIGQYQLLGPKIDAMIPNSKLYMLENIGHLPHIENFQMFKQVFEKEI